MSSVMHRLPLLAALALALGGCERPPVTVEQHGYRGLAMEQNQNPRTLAKLTAANAVPAEIPAAAPGGPRAGDVFQNVKVLGDLTAPEFTRLMLAMTAWVAPADQGCSYCHGADMSSDALYTKQVARRMLQMVRTINGNWSSHVGDTGVTCYTCHRGHPVPSQLWYTDSMPSRTVGIAGDRAGQNAPAPSVGLSSLPNDPFTPFLLGSHEIGIEASTALPAGDRHSIKETEWTYGLMMHISDSLGVNCTYCHTSRQFKDWDQSTPARAKAWYGIRMTRELNVDFLTPLTPVFPANRKGPHGDVGKVDCATCHQGVSKPLFGAHMAASYPELTGAPPAAATAEATTTAAVAPTGR
jgi:photosynthetic reaction center cytochrome c subunit